MKVLLTRENPCLAPCKALVFINKKGAGSIQVTGLHQIKKPLNNRRLFVVS
jgi:hypothetical protein